MSGSWIERWKGKLRTQDDCVRFVDDLGFCTIDRVERFLDFPNQAEAMELDMAIGHTWFWKDDLHIEKRLFYTRLFFNKPGYISMDLLPVLIATNGQVADELVVMGRMPVVQRAVYDLIEKYGPISSFDLREDLSPETKKQSAAALIALERAFIITKVGITGRKLGTYSYIWDMAEKWVPSAFEEADRIGAKQARAVILDRVAQNGLAAEQDLLAAAFGWE